MTGNKYLLLLTLSGLSSGLLTCAFMPFGQQVAGLHCGVVFGCFLVVPLAISGILDQSILFSLLKALGLIVFSTAAYYLPFMTAAGLQMDFPQIVPSAERWDMATAEPASPIALFVGGLVGGFLVFAIAIFLSRSEFSKGVRAPKIIQGALLGGALGIAGWVLRSSIGAAVWNLLHAFGRTPPWELCLREWLYGNYDYGQRSRMYSLYVVWQTVIAAATGIILRHPIGKRKATYEDLRMFNS